MGLVVFAAFGAYLLISFAVIFGAIRYARGRGKSVRRWGFGAALAMYLVVFWDHIPTLLAHKYYCEKEAGFWVYKTAEQWAKENPRAAAVSRPDTIKLGQETYPLNERVDWNRLVIPVELGLRRVENSLDDHVTGDRLALAIDFASGRCSGSPTKLSDFKRWNVHCACDDENGGDLIEMRFLELRRKFQDLEGAK